MVVMRWRRYIHSQANTYPFWCWRYPVPVQVAASNRQRQKEQVFFILRSHMKERPILFSSEMVRAILEGRKTQTRRIMKPQPERYIDFWKYDNEYFLSDETMQSHLFHNVYGEKGSPYGSVYGNGEADKLWVRETFVLSPAGRPVYRADYTDLSPYPEVMDFDTGESTPFTWKPSIFMPRWASRITLEIVDVRVERLQDISSKDAAAEGVECEIVDQSVSVKNYTRKDGVFNSWGLEDSPDFIYEPIETIFQRSYRTLWEKINGPGSWDTNPWVWVIEFKQVTPAA